MLLSILTCTDTSTPNLRGQSRPCIFGAQFAELAGKVCDEAVPDLVALMEENRKVIGKSLALAELCGRQTRNLAALWKDPPSGRAWSPLRLLEGRGTRTPPGHAGVDPWASTSLGKRANPAEGMLSMAGSTEALALRG